MSARRPSAVHPTAQNPRGGGPGAHPTAQNPRGGGPEAPRGQQLRRAAPVFAALGDTTRLGLVAALSTGGPLSIAGLTATSHVTRQAVTKHLQVLESAGLVRSSRVGRESIWELNPQPLGDARRSLDLISSQWDQSLGRLKALVERPE
jgi:DNA-binding transcriptional ArsR family regulator